MQQIEQSKRVEDLEPQPHIKDRSPAEWESLILQSDAEALKQLNVLHRNNQYYFEHNNLSEVQGVSNSLGAVLNYIDDEFAEGFRTNLAASKEALFHLSDYIREQAQEQGRTEFFVLAGMTGELVSYYRELQANVRERGREKLEDATAEVNLPVFASQALAQSQQKEFEFELVRIPESVNLMVHSDASKFSGALMHSHALLINVYFTPDQNMRSPQEIERILEYVDDALHLKSENYYWQGF